MAIVTRTRRNRIEMTIDEQCVFGSVSRFEFNDDILNVSIMMRQSVHELQVEGSARLLNVDRHLVDRVGTRLDGLQFATEKIRRENFIFVTS